MISGLNCFISSWSPQLKSTEISLVFHFPIEHSDYSLQILIRITLLKDRDRFTFWYRSSTIFDSWSSWSTDDHCNISDIQTARGIQNGTLCCHLNKYPISITLWAGDRDFIDRMKIWEQRLVYDRVSHRYLSELWGYVIDFHDHNEYHNNFESLWDRFRSRHSPRDHIGLAAEPFRIICI